LGVDGWVGFGWDAGVPEYDAFGREIADDPLKAFRAPPQPQPQPVAEREPEPVAAAQPRLEFVRPGRRRSGGLARLIVLLAVLGAVGLALVGGVVGTSVESGIDDIVEGVGVDDPPAAVTGRGSDPPATAPPSAATGGSDPRASLIRRARFADAVGTLAASGLGRPLTMRVAPDRIDATLIGKGGRLNQVQITPGSDLKELASSDGAPGPTIPYTAIDPAAPERLVRAGATKKVPAGSIDYLVVTAGPQWAAYYKGGRIVIGDAHGRRQRVIGRR
jgi:hypothetical protein